MKCLFYYFYFGIILFPIFILAKENTIAIYLKSNELSEEQLSVIENRIVDCMIRLNKYKIIERSDIDVLLNEQAFQLKEIVDEKSIVNFSKIIGVKELLICEVNEISKIYYINIRIENVESGQISKSYTSPSGYRLTTVFNNIPTIINQTFFPDSSKEENKYENIEYNTVTFRETRNFVKVDTLTPNYLLTISNKESLINTDINNDLIYISGTGGNIYQCDFQNPSQINKIFSYPFWEFNQIVVSNSGRYFAAGSKQGTTYLWKSTYFDAPYYLDKNNSPISGVCFLEKQSSIVTSDYSGKIIIWDLNTIVRKYEQVVSNSGIISISTCLNSTGLIMLCEDGNILLYDVGNKKISAKNSIGTVKERVVCCGNKGVFFITGSSDGTIHIRRTSRFVNIKKVNNTWFKPYISLIKTIKVGNIPITSIDIAPSEDIFVIGYIDGSNELPRRKHRGILTQDKPSNNINCPLYI